MVCWKMDRIQNWDETLVSCEWEPPTEEASFKGSIHLTGGQNVEWHFVENNL